MPDQLTLDVIDRPSEGTLKAMRRLHALRRRGAPGLRAFLQLGTARFVPVPYPQPTLRRVGALAVWDADVDVDVEDRWQAALGDLCDGAEHWHVRGEVTRAAFTAPWSGWTADAEGARPLEADEPALILISGELKARYVPRFFIDGAHAVAHAFDHPGYLGGLAIATSPLNTTSCSAWRTYADARSYAYRPGGHATAMRRDKANEHHRTEHFVRIRPLAERGTLNGAAPFAGLSLGSAASGGASLSASRS